MKKIIVIFLILFMFAIGCKQENNNVKISLSSHDITFEIEKEEVIDASIITKKLYSNIKNDFLLFDYDLYYDNDGVIKNNPEILDTENDCALYENTPVIENTTLYLKEKSFDSSKIDFKLCYDIINGYFDCDKDYDYFISQIEKGNIISISRFLNFDILDGEEVVKLYYNIETTDGKILPKYLIMPITNYALLRFDGFRGSCITFDSTVVLKKGSLLDFYEIDGIELVGYTWIEMNSLNVYENKIENCDSSMLLRPYSDTGLYEGTILNYFEENNNFPFLLNHQYQLEEFDEYNLKNITGETFDIEVNDSTYTFTKIEYEGTYFLSSIKTDYLFIDSDKSTDEILNVLYNSNIHNSYTISINNESEYKYNVILNYLYPVG